MKCSVELIKDCLKLSNPADCTPVMKQTNSYFELVFQDEDDDFKVHSVPEGHLVQDLLAAPPLLLQSVADDAHLLHSRVEVKRHVSARLHAAATGEVHLKPVHTGTRHLLKLRTRTCFSCHVVHFTWQHQAAQNPARPPFLLEPGHPELSRQRGWSVGNMDK